MTLAELLLTGVWVLYGREEYDWIRFQRSPEEWELVDIIHRN